MLIIDRYILARFLSNFAILFSLLFIFAIAIDLILNLDDFVDKAKELSGEDGSPFTTFILLLKLALDFQAPKFFQFYAYLHGLVAIGAMGFTLAHMHRYKELVAVLASGMSLQRVAMPFIGGIFIISLLQLINQEFFLPRVAPLLLRDHGEIGEKGLEAFEVQFTRDSQGTLLISPEFNPQTNSLVYPTFFLRNEKGITNTRISADSATWDDSSKGWRLEQGVSLTASDPDAAEFDSMVVKELIDFYPSEISPRMLTVRRHSQFAAMLSLNQISDMLESREAPDVGALIRFRFSRFSSVLINILIMVITLPAFLLREPSNLMSQSVICAGIAIPCSFGAILGMMVDLPGIPPAAGVFLPVIILIPVALARVTFLKT